MTSVTEEIQQLREVFAALNAASDEEKDDLDLLEVIFRVQRFYKVWEEEGRKFDFMVLHGTGKAADRARREHARLEAEGYIPPTKVFEKEICEIEKFISNLHKKYTDTTYAETDKSRPSGIYLVRLPDGSRCIAKFTQKARETCAFSLPRSRTRIGTHYYHWSQWVGFTEVPLGEENPDVLESNPSVYGNEGAMMEKMLKGDATITSRGFRE